MADFEPGEDQFLPLEPAPVNTRPDMPGIAYSYEVPDYLPLPSAGKCCPNDEGLKQVIAYGFASVAAALERINDNLYKKFSDPCDNISKCMDKIEYELKKRWEKPIKTCCECQQMVKNGLAGTVEFAVQCAGSCIGKYGAPCEEECDPYYEECPPKKKEKEQFIGWCNNEQQTAIVTKKDEPPPGAGYHPVAYGDNYDTVLDQARANCRKEQEPSTPQPSPEPVPIPVYGAGCNIDSYADGTALRQIASSGAGANFAAASIRAAQVTAQGSIEGFNIENVGQMVWAGFALNKSWPSYMAKMLSPALAAGIGCPSQDWSTAFQTLTSFSTAENYLGVDLSDFTIQYRYAMNAACPNKHLEPEKATAAYLADSITKKQLETYYAIAGYCKDAMTQYIDAARAKPTPDELMVMARRELITHNEYDVWMRRLGYTEQGEIDLIYKSSEQVPPMQEILRYMVRDADDENVVNQFGLDALFDDKYRSQLKKWAKDQGIPEEVARMSWRAHWTIPSPTALFDFYHRLRKNDKFGGEAKLLQDVKAALVQQDILPFWHEYYLATSFHPLTRVDLRRMFVIGQIDEKQLFTGYTEIGYSDENAKILANFTKRERDNFLRNHWAIKEWIKGNITRDKAKEILLDFDYEAGEIDKALAFNEFRFITAEQSKAYSAGRMTKDDWVSSLKALGVDQVGVDSIFDRLKYKISNHPAVRSYIVGTVNRQNAKSEMTKSGIPDEVAEKMLHDAEFKIDDSLSMDCERGLRRRFVNGELDQQDAVTALNDHGIVLERANKIVDSWGCIKKSRGREIPAAKLCSLLSSGVIRVQDFLRRLKNVGYNDDDAMLMLADCLSGINAKRQRQAEKEAKDELATQRRLEQERKRLAAATTRAEAAQKRASDAAIAARINREKQLIKAIDNVAQQTGAELYPVNVAIRADYNRIRSAYAFTVDEGLQIILLASEQYDGETVDGFSEYVTAMSEAAISGGFASLSTGAGAT